MSMKTSKRLLIAMTVLGLTLMSGSVLGQTVTEVSGTVTDPAGEFLVGNTAMFLATERMVGMERALSIHREIMDEVCGGRG